VHRLESRVVALLKEIGALNREAAAHSAGNHPLTLSLVTSGRDALAAAWSAIGELQVCSSSSSSYQLSRYSTTAVNSGSMSTVRQQTQAMVVMADRKAATFEAFAIQAEARRVETQDVESAQQIHVAKPSSR